MPTEPLNVDPDRLAAAGTALQRVSLPELTPPIVAPGTDPLSAAINETAPIIESPIGEGLADVNAAVARSASNIIAAARAYADADQKLGSYVNQAPAGTDDAHATGGAVRALAPARGTDPTPAPTPTPTPSPTAWDFGGTAESAAVAAQGLSQGMQVVMQGVQTVVGSASHAHPAPAALASAQTDAEEARRTRLVGDERPSDLDTATSAAAPAGVAPVDGPPPDRSSDAPSGSAL